MIELEKTYLAKYVPKGLGKCKYEEILDIYIPKSVEHPILRIRKQGNKHEMTKKEPVRGRDSSRQREQTIPLTREEFQELAGLEGKRMRKKRHYFPFKGRTAEIDVYLGSLKGLVVVDFEFKNRKEMNSFKMPEFCLADVTQEKCMAGGMICGKSYKELEKELEKYSYKKLFLE